MKRTKTHTIFSATDLSHYVHCKHILFLDQLASEGKLEKPQFYDRTLALYQERGVDFETAFHTSLMAEGKRVVEITHDYSTADAATIAAMQGGADVIYQGRLSMEPWAGWTDFLMRVEKPSKLGSWSYEVLDTKLASETRVGTILQIGLYSLMLEQLQGVLPEYMHVENPEGRTSYRTEDHVAYVRLLMKRFLAAFEARTETYPEPVAQCDLCSWWDHCNARRRADDHLSFVAGMGSAQIKEVKKHGVTTLQQWAETPLPLPFEPERGSLHTYERLREQARVQLESRTLRQPVYELLPRIADTGFFLLPKPNANDIYFDFEGDPMVEPMGREYLFGWIHKGQYHALWAECETDERNAFETFVDYVTKLKKKHPGMHVYHFGAYEPAALKRLMGKYATREDGVDALLRSGAFVDLHRILKQSVRAGVERYSLKDLERYRGYIREMDLRELGPVKADYEFMLESGNLAEADPAWRDVIAKYNEDDCASTVSLQKWLEQLRASCIEAGEEIPRPQPKDAEPNDKITEHQKRIRPLYEHLMNGLPEVRNAEEQARYLLAHMLDWYRREQKSFWWEVYRLRDLEDADLLAERKALSMLVPVGKPVRVARSFVYTYEFPIQEFEGTEGKALKDREGAGAGSIYQIDYVKRQIQVKKGGDEIQRDDLPTALFTLEHIEPKHQEASIIRLAARVCAEDFGFDPASDLLLRRNPRFVSPPVRKKTTLETAIEQVLKLDNSILPIQGPPGSGKSYTASHMILALVMSGKKVGITALSHKVIENLLLKVHELALEKDYDISILQKPERDADGWAEWDYAENNEEMADDTTHQVLAGTPFLWAREDMQESVDYLFVDEAGQLSLIDTLAISHAGKNMVLLGDPQQLSQPQQGVHPPGTEVSALHHVLGEQPTILPEQGIFLSETYRMHPKICGQVSELFYENKLAPVNGLEKQALRNTKTFEGSGLYVRTVNHKGNSNNAPEEIEEVVKITKELLNGKVKWRNNKGIEQTLTERDIKIISPYNAQVELLKEALPQLSIGTVDKFQGQEAPVIIFSMASSSIEDAPRGMEFLFSPNRLNVAISRAKAAFILVCSPELLTADCQSPHQVKLANALCRVLEVSM